LGQMLDLARFRPIEPLDFLLFRQVGTSKIHRNFK
jgi:hypothetical protein